MMRPFAPVDDATASISVTTTTARAAIDGAPQGEFQLRLYNAGTATAFYALGNSSVEAAATDVPLPSGAIEVITITNPQQNPVTHIAAITASSTATLYVTTGNGI
jgi:hypothetical protein